MNFLEKGSSGCIAIKCRKYLTLLGNDRRHSMQTKSSFLLLFRGGSFSRFSLQVALIYLYAECENLSIHWMQLTDFLFVVVVLAILQSDDMNSSAETVAGVC